MTLSLRRSIFRAKDRIDRSGRGRWAVGSEAGRQLGGRTHRRAPVTAGNDSVSNIVVCMLAQGERLPASGRTGDKGHSQYNPIQALY